MAKLNTATITQDEIKKADTKDLLDTYNAITEENLSRFSDRAAAERRTWKVIQQLAPGENIQVETTKGKESMAKKVTPIKKAKEKVATVKKRDAYETRVIKVLAKENPKRPGSKAYKKFEILMNHDGKTIRDFKEREGKYPTLDDEPGWAATELRWAQKLELVKVVNSPAA